ncbi:MAG: DUF2721 domain-containing protein [Planctomycetaceae bacterium]|nr:DUF2721 domain-containing protein [Planctomycetaceae bacterium]
MSMTNLLGAGDVLAAMITPAVLISASGMLVLSTSNRLGRVVDRIRELTELAEALPDESAAVEVIEKRALIADQIGWLSRRLERLQTALVILYASIGLLVASSLTVGISAAANGVLSWVPIGLALIGATGLMTGAGMLVGEARMAVRGTLNELDHIRRVVGRKTTMRLNHIEKPEGGQGEG